jgi:predicted small metal-binding protein
MKKVACDAVVPGCPFTASAETDEELLELVAVHAGHTHGIEEVSLELIGKVKKAIQVEKVEK